VRYLVVGGYAVALHGYPRTTGDLGVWVEQSESNAERIVAALRVFGFDVPALRPALFLEDERVVRMGRPPLRIELLTSVSGVRFAFCYGDRVTDRLGDAEASVIGLGCLKANKRASGRNKDLDDLEHIP
jgi:hypothetical protein